MSIIVSKFFCDGAGNDCPETGFEVVRTKGNHEGVKVKKGDFLLDSDLANMMENGIEVVVGFVLR